MTVVPTIKLFIFALILGLFQTHAIQNVAVIGAGAAGLASAKHALDYGYNVTIYEKSEKLGGVWYYTEKTGNNSFGVPVHSPNYQGLRTNVPYQIMEYPDFHYPPGTKSYPTAKEVWNYLDSYAREFKLSGLIKLNHLVENVIPLENGSWRVYAKAYPTKTLVSKVFDAVLVCTNLYSYPYTPDIDGINDFKLKKIHSHDYRKAADFRGKEVLIIGGGPSGVDIAQLISKTAKRVMLSTNTDILLSDDVRQKLYGKNSTFKPVVRRLTSNGADFEDGTSQTFNAVIFATGYRYKFPFLKNAGIKTDDNLVYPLFNQILNVNYPTMALIGIPYLASFYSFSMEARFALKFISGELKMPTKDEMNFNFNEFIGHLRANNIPKSKSHFLGTYTKIYYDYIAMVAKIETIPSYYGGVYADAIQSFHTDPIGFRNYKYIIDGDSFDKVKEK
ncbi:senecionine N-oxygenase-like [Contarinia nasturtii]|uniref:senecionine N-oxygenase-like n=1 Tax=Contarinia nasturtii TaxID=265458 RepID=UPI0012D43D2F|nr:senecionine N-oxygenase-like [Contarinia nasturtii]